MLLLFCYCRGCVHFARHLEQRLQVGLFCRSILNSENKVEVCFQMRGTKLKCSRRSLDATPFVDCELLQVSCVNMEKVKCEKVEITSLQGS